MDKKTGPRNINLFCSGVGLHTSQTQGLITLMFGTVVPDGDRHLLLSLFHIINIRFSQYVTEGIAVFKPSY